MTLEGKTIVVTGAAAGIGRGIAKAAVGAGATVYGLDVAEDAEARIEALGATPLRADVAEPDSFRAAIGQAHAQTGRLDGLVNNAGLTLTAPFLDADIAMWERLWQVNHCSVLVGCQAAAKLMVAAGTGGSLVNVASVHASASDQGYEAYAGTKGAVVAMGRAMAWSLGPHGIRVNTLNPGLTETEAVARVAEAPGNDALFRSWHADNSIPQVDEVAQIATFLLSDAAAALTGTEINADKGTLARLCNVGP